MTEEEYLAIFNRVHSNYSALLYDYSKKHDFAKMQEATNIFTNFLIIYQYLIDQNIEYNDLLHLTKLSFRDIEKDKKILKLKEKTSQDS